MAKKKNSNVIEARGGGWYQLPSGEKVRGRNQAEFALGASQPSLTGRFNFLRQAGLQYKGLRDIYKTAGYVLEGQEGFDLYSSLNERDPVAGRIIEMPPKTTWRTPPEVFEGEQDTERQLTKFEVGWTALVKRLRLWRHFERADRLSRIGEYGVLLIGGRIETDKQLEEPLEGLKSQEDILFLSAFAQKFATIETWDTDPTSERFGLPTMYEVELSNGVKDFKAKAALVHWTRIIHIAEDPVNDEVHGRPALKRALNALDDLLKVTASTGEAYWQLASRVLQGTIDPDMELGDGDLKTMGESMEAIVHDLRRQFLGHGVDLKWLSGETPKPEEAMEVYKALMAVASGIPTRILFGSERGELASQQDERTYFGTIHERQEHHAEPNILRAFIDRVVGAGAIPPTGEEGYKVVWAALFELSDLDIAKANLVRAQTAKELTPMGGDPRELVEVDEQRNVWVLPSEGERLADVVPDSGTGADDDLVP